ncbi:putative stage IV sporulation protein YqfD [Gottschalkia acidurici 9a]|uniref:Stage IV sporulation protein YqfD n=1 Tax=Gottschalkia acidurici (strain ATCC 7906 / DSM 604 / BCRC 14475 / CIP 104303 / KCTC 5404 / NCIMB 10678 / 9a) TaxID=1128398 RepID=K0B1J4_GOTA9|nr:sporulation protein YqfD [Gottschalkia acidurici]AFS78825.1 putative stage IV sporulation protein YqfD [Gottschalkia acidurici 9a]
MFVIRLWNYLKGYVIIKVEGLTLEKFINLSISKNIFLWDIERIDYTTLEAKVSTAGFRELKDVVKAVDCRVSIEGKRGFPFFIYKFKYRKMLLLGLVFSIFIIGYLTSFIWTIDIVGNENIKDEVIRKNLESINVKQGIRKKDLDIEDIKSKILINVDELSYLSLNIKGVKLTVEVKERDTESKIVEDESPCNIIAGKKAVIEKVVAKNGKSVVEKGDIVKKGQLIVTGVIQDEGMDSPLLVHADGKVIGLTTRSEIVKEPLMKNIKEETGKIHISREVKINGKSLEFMNGDIPFKNYVEKKEIKRPLKNELFDLPLEIVIHEYREVNIREAEQNIDALKKSNEVKAVQKLMSKLPKDAEVISKNTNHNIDNNIVTTKVTIDVREEIGVKSKINSINNLQKQED